MFTGLVETTGKLRAHRSLPAGARLRFETGEYTVQIGDSVAVSGACLTVAELDGQGFWADVSTETLNRTTLGQLELGATVNLERALRLGDRLGGHLVTGHVDGVAEVCGLEKRPGEQRVGLEFPRPLAAFIAEKGSVAVDGVSLTVNGVEAQRLWLMLIPHTLSITNLAELCVGRRVNFEVDLFARYVARYFQVATEAQSQTADARLRSVLSAAGFLKDSA